MARKLKMRSGFTLVELLIVIMIIAILAGMMMLATGSASDTANATRVINDLRALKTATTLAALDMGLTGNQISDWQYWMGGAPGVDENNNVFKKISDSMDAPLMQTGVTEGYAVTPGRTTIEGIERSLVGFDIDSSTLDYLTNANVQKKLEEQAESVGLYDADGNFYTVGKSYIGMIVN